MPPVLPRSVEMELLLVAQKYEMGYILVHIRGKYCSAALIRKGNVLHGSGRLSTGENRRGAIIFKGLMPLMEFTPSLAPC